MYFLYDYVYRRCGRPTQGKLYTWDSDPKYPPLSNQVKSTHRDSSVANMKKAAVPLSSVIRFESTRGAHVFVLPDGENKTRATGGSRRRANPAPYVKYRGSPSFYNMALL